MRLTEEQLKEIFRQQPARSSPRQIECLTENQFVRAAMEELSSEERRALARHLITCTDCTEEYRALKSLKPWAEELHHALEDSAKGLRPLEASPVQSFPGAERTTFNSATRSGRTSLRSLRDSVSTFWQQIVSEPRARRFAAIAVLILMAGSSLVIWQSVRQQEPPTSTERAPVSLTPSVEPPNKATVSGPPERLTWPPVEQTISYRVVLFDFQSTPIWESSLLTEPAATIPEPVRQRLQPNRPYYWRVIAEDAIEQHQSELFQFTIAAGERK